MDKVSKYEAARDWLGFLIDHPDKTVSVRGYRAMIKAAKDAVASAHKDALASHG